MRVRFSPQLDAAYAGNGKYMKEGCAYAGDYCRFSPKLDNTHLHHSKLHMQIECEPGVQPTVRNNCFDVTTTGRIIAYLSTWVGITVCSRAACYGL